MAIVGACQFGRLVATDRVRAIQNYKVALTMGNTRALPELFQAVGITFPFMQPAVEDALQFVVEEMANLRRSQGG